MGKVLPWLLVGLLGLGLVYEMVDRRLDQAAIEDIAARRAACAAAEARFSASRPDTSAPVPDWRPLARLMAESEKYRCDELPPIR